MDFSLDLVRGYSLFDFINARLYENFIKVESSIHFLELMQIILKLFLQNMINFIMTPFFLFSFLFFYYLYCIILKTTLYKRKKRNNFYITY